MRKVVFLVCTGLVLAFTSPARAQRAAYATPDELPGEGQPHALDVALLGAYGRGLDGPHDLRSIGTLAERTRLYLGRTFAYCAGLDGEVGGSNGGAVYGVTAYAAGLAMRWGEGNVFAVASGAGFDRTGAPASLAARFPVDLSVAFSVGPTRPMLWLRPAWTAGEEARRHGASVGFIDELEAGLIVRLARERHYWSATTAGGGVAIGIGYRELVSAHIVLAYFGFALEGGQ